MNHDRRTVPFLSPENGVKKHEFESAYNDAGLPISFWYGIKEGTSTSGRKYSYVYNTDESAKSMIFPNESSKTWTYDGLKRRTKEVYKPIKTPTAANTLNIDYTYLAGNPANTNSTTNLLSTYKNSLGTVAKNQFTYEYTPAGNISKITDNITGKVITYTYDDLSRLLRENNQVINKTLTYTHDIGGNILTVKEHAYTTATPGVATNTHTYTYPASGWKDQLTSYNGQPIEYDAIGNPTTYLGKTLTWERGRKLKTLTAPSLAVSYTYGTDGTRLSKTVNGGTTTYTNIAGQLVQEKTQAYELNYYYDSTGLLTSLGYKPTGTTTETYYFVTRNAQGDIIAIYNSANSSPVGTYTYDSWGKVTATTLASTTSDPNGIMTKNPFRYRGYYYDRETDFYYLQARYYDPETKRFINADGLISTGTGVQGYNMYAYCNSNPVNFSDPSGMCVVDWSGTYDCKNAKCRTSGYNKYNDGLGDAPPGQPSAPVPGVPGTTYTGHGNARDFLASEGTPFYATVGGTVVSLQNIYLDSYNIYPYNPEKGGDRRGNYVQILVWDGSIMTYCHAQQNGFIVSVGDEVKRGAMLGLVGNTGNSSTPHLHLEVSGEKDITFYLPKS